MMKYPKIQTLWKRDPDDKFKIIPGDYSKEEFPNITNWSVTEKVHGTNIRVGYEEDDFAPDEHEGYVVFRGRKDTSDIPAFLVERLTEMFPASLFKGALKSPREVILIGEGFGGRIQKVGKKYREESDFILFDVYINGWWLTRDGVADVAEKLGIEMVDDYDVMTIDEAVKLVKSAPDSKTANEKLTFEGIVARSEPLMLFRDGTPMMWKLKVRDYRDIGEIE